MGHFQFQVYCPREILAHMKELIYTRILLDNIFMVMKNYKPPQSQEQENGKV